MFGQLAPQDRLVMSQNQAMSFPPMSKRQCTRSGMPQRSGPGTVVAGCHVRGEIPWISACRMAFATVLRDTAQPALPRSAQNRRDPYVPSEASWNTVTRSVEPIHARNAGRRRRLPGGPPLVEPAPVHTQQTRHPHHRVVRLLRLDQLERVLDVFLEAK